MPTTDQPEEPPSRISRQPADLPPDLTIRQWKGADVPPEPEAEKPNGQSVFSARSGIQDPLIKSQPELSPPDAEAIGEESVALPDSEEEEETVQPGKKLKGKGVPKPGRKLLKSRRQIDRARRRQENYLQKRRKEKKLKVFYGRIKSILKFCFALLWGVLLWEMAHSSLWLFNAPRFDVENNHLVQPSQLAPLVKPLVGKPIYNINTGKLAEQIEERFELVERAVVRRTLFPASLNVQIFEKKPWASLYAPASYDKAQKQLNDKSTENPQSGKSGTMAKPVAQGKMALLPYGVAADEDLVSLRGYQYQPTLYAGTERILVNPQTPLKASYLLHLREIAWQARQIQGLNLEAVDIRNPNQVILRYREIPVILGKLDRGASDRLARLMPLLPKIQEYRDVIESVDLKWEEQVTFHKKPNVQLKKPPEEQVQG